ncbi:cyclic nucleotide-binding protein [Magnetococcus marinus MC-1]|uniref:diguanylate cyclase n=1 Tax=Magnetococcus marinus (strain ATCC BAA-1437 / JCM 17883 / MC-1) TaxID=156889 RepID=A0L7F5_MAGMM|nr:GGDEF domain-containing protein [Magnetococcus marinus]ABK43898.1 cyclic nucleotide-binding protein [Magnetococcus marinus MC-1]
MKKTKYQGESYDQLHLFYGVGYESVAYVLEDCWVYTMQHDDIIISPDYPNDALYVLLEGQARVHLGGIQTEPLLILETGSCVGELSIIDQGRASAYVLAEGATKLLSIDESRVWSLIHSSHTLACNLLNILSKRMRNNNRVIIEGSERQRKLETFAKVDPLTGIYNRRWFDESMQRQMRRVEHSQNPLSLIMLDVDHFKRYNDTHGHQGGDEALIALAHTISLHLRPGDIAARYGGEEFAVVLPDTDAVSGRMIAERLRTAVEALEIKDDEGNSLSGITISLGVAQTSGTVDSVSELIATADAALYQAKNQGRNRVVVGD